MIQPGFLHKRRLASVVEELRKLGVQCLLDMGCGQGDLVAAVLAELEIPTIVGVDASPAAISYARRRFAHDRRARITFIEADIRQPCDLPERPDAVALVEVIEHLGEGPLRLMRNALFGHLRPRHVFITTPNAEYNCLLGVPPTRYRHPDHEFEWDRAKFAHWATRAADRFGYLVRIQCIAGQHPRFGGPSQMACFSLPFDTTFHDENVVHGSHDELGCCAAARFGGM